MAIVVTDTTVEDADAYFSTRLGSEIWLADVSKKKPALQTAANLMNAMEWNGRAVNSDAAFPRYFNGASAAVTPVSILWALYEFALHLLMNPAVLGEEESVETLVLGPLQLQNISTAKLIPKIVQRYISPYTFSNGGVTGGGRWWRAN